MIVKANVDSKANGTAKDVANTWKLIADPLKLAVKAVEWISYFAVDKF